MSQEPITVVVADEGRHLFDAVRDPNVRVVSAAECACPDLVVFPCGRFRRFENVARLTLPDPLRASIAAGRVGLVFDSSLEGIAHKPDITAALHDVIRRLGAKPRQCMYVTQDRQYEADYSAHCASIDAQPVSVLVHDYWIWYALGQYEANGDDVFRHRADAFRARPPQRTRTFISFNRTPRPTKILFLLRLLADGLWDRGFISFGGFRRTADGPGKDRPSPDELRRALPGFEDLVAQVAPYIDRLDAYGRVLFGVEQHGWKRVGLAEVSAAVELLEYDDSWLTVVTETEMRPRPARITEKVVKPLVNFHPLLVFGNPGALAMIRSYGFVTFEDVFDESYDDEWDPRRRFERVYAEVIRACRWSDEEWRSVEARIEEKLIFNARWGLTQFPRSYRRQRDAVLVTQILEALGVRRR
jgi:hypothetical protein